jgi:hypothetical protein
MHSPVDFAVSTSFESSLTTVHSEQVARRLLLEELPDDYEMRVSDETIYQSL